MDSINESNDPAGTVAGWHGINESNETPVTPEEYAQFLAADAADLEPRPGVPVPTIHLAEAPGLPEGGEVGVRVPVNVIMDQMHQHYAQIIAGQVQRNAELAAALTTTSDELVELRSKFAALQSVTNAPDPVIVAEAVRTILPD